MYEERFLPFARDDAYGELGLVLYTGNVFQKLRIFFLAVTLVPLRAFLSLWLITSFYVWVRLSVLLPPRHRSLFIASLGKIHCRICLLVLGFVKVRWIKVKDAGYGRNLECGTLKPAGIVSNHCSWADILVHMAHSFPAFAAKAQTKKMPFVGLISQAMDCLYVDREQSQGVAGLVRDRMIQSQNGTGDVAHPMLLFPEGTTTNGKYLLPFKTGAFLAGVPLQPVVLRYGTGRVSPSWDTIPGSRHVFLMLCEPFHSVTCYELPVYVPNEQEKNDPKVYAENLHRCMRKFAHMKETTATYPDKVKFHEVLEKKYGIVRNHRKSADKIN